MSDIRLMSAQTTVSRNSTDSKLITARGTRDGSLFTIPWIQGLVMEGKVFGINAGAVTTAIAAKAAIDADQPEMAVYTAADTTVLMPVHLWATLESGSTTLGVHGVQLAISNISVGAGTSTAATPLNQNLSSGNASSATAKVAYTGNGTDPLTAGNYQILKHSGGVIDSDAATSGVPFMPTAEFLFGQTYWSPIVANTGSILGYGEGVAGAVFWGGMVWAEFTEAEIE